MTTINRMLKVKTNKTYDGWDWNMDGQYDEPLVKGKDKKRRNKHQRTLEKRFTTKEIIQAPMM